MTTGLLVYISSRQKQDQDDNRRASSHTISGLELSVVFRLLAALLLLTLALQTAFPAQRKTQRKAPPAGQSGKTATRPRTVTPPPALSPRETLDRARLAETQKERIALLERFIATQTDTALVAEGRQLLMREYALRGEQYLREASPQLALKDFKAAFRVAPPEITDRIFSQYIFPLPMAMNAFGYRTESVELMRSFEGRFASDVNRLVQIGFFYIQIEAPLDAVRVLERAVGLGPDNSRAHNSLGTAYLINLRLDDAAVEFRRALEINPKDEYANLNLANLVRSSGSYEEAIDYYRKHLEMKPDDAEALGGLAIALLAVGRDEEAEPAARRAMELAPEGYRFLVQLAYFYVTRKKAALARPLIERAFAIEPRYAWTAITKANIDSLEGKHGDALATLITSQKLASFPTLNFELVKGLMALDGYDQAIEIMSKAFRVTADGEYEALLGGAVKTRSPRLDLLLERERHAALFLNDHPTTSMQYRLAEALGRMDHFIRAAAAQKTQASAARRRAGRADSRAGQRGEGQQEEVRPRRARAMASPGAELSAGADSRLPGVAELIGAITAFTTLDDGRQAFRMVWVARKLTENGIALTAAEQLVRRALEMADSATEPGGSMRDAPLLNREGRRAVFLGRAYDALGWALFKMGDTQGALDNLAKSVEHYPPCAERKAALWHLATATEESGDETRALELYIASYEPDHPAASARRVQIETLYKRLKGSLAGLEDRLKRQ
jgi:tetratricopeptide (TPR) repeat protein